MLAPSPPSPGFRNLDHSAVALIAAGQEITYPELAALAENFAQQTTHAFGARNLGFILAHNDLATVAAYLGSLRHGNPVALLPATCPDTRLESLLARYRPEWLLLPAGRDVPPGYAAARWQTGTLCIDDNPQGGNLHPDLALLLMTSGSTGSPRMVRLSTTALATNAAAIADYLALAPDERAITSLPVSYSYGLSVLNSHLHVGATVLLTDEPVLARPFWDLCRDRRATSLAGVPYTYQMLRRLNLARMDLPDLRTLTQAGGRLDPALKAEFLTLAEARGWRMFSMYGQTEATARIAYVPPERLRDKLDSIGIAIPGGALSLAPGSNELLYRGPGVMMGYAECRQDLARGDELGGILATGDLAAEDADGYFSLRGRLKRIAKVFGNRVNLDEVEGLLESAFPALQIAALDGGERLLLAVHGDAAPSTLSAWLHSALNLHPSGFQVIATEALPMTAGGKKDYPAIAERIAR